jgi:hypothetical protein
MGYVTEVWVWGKEFLLNCKASFGRTTQGYNI